MATKISSSVELGSPWANLTIGSDHSFYIAAVKEEKGVNDTIDPKDVKRIVFETGVNMNTSEPLTTGYIVLDFDVKTSLNAELNEATALVRCDGYPETFPVRPSLIHTKDKVLTEGTTTISINVQPVSLR